LGRDHRNFGDGVGARSQMLRIGWEPPFGGYLEERIRTLANQSYYGGDLRQYSQSIAPFPYRHYYDFTVRYSRPWKGLTIGGEVFAGRDFDGKSFSRLSGFVRYGGDGEAREEGALDDDGEAPDEHGAERFVDVGMNLNRRTDVGLNLIVSARSQLTQHFAIGARRAVPANNDFGSPQLTKSTDC
jgi:hypothetical protein